MEISVDPIVAFIIPLIIGAVRRLSDTVADSPYWSIGLAVLLGALVALADSLGVPLPTPGGVDLLTGITSAVLAVGGVEVVKLAPGVRSLNKSNTMPRLPKPRTR